MEKECLKILGVRIGSASKELLDMYCKKHHIKSHTKAARKIVELGLLGKPIVKEDDVYNAMYYAENIYLSLGGYIESIIRKDLKNELPICQNCKHYKNNICTLYTTTTNPFSKFCINGELLENSK